MPPDPPSRHACVLHTTIILLPSCFPPQLKILYENLLVKTSLRPVAKGRGYMSATKTVGYWKLLYKFTAINIEEVYHMM